MITKVQKFNKKFGLPSGENDLLSDEASNVRLAIKLRKFRLKFLREEVNELEFSSNRVKMFDALLDLVYVAQGTALFMGISPDQWEQGMDAVHRANMKKVRVESATDSKRGSSFDIKKPAGWVGPESELFEILQGGKND